MSDPAMDVSIEWLFKRYNGKEEYVEKANDERLKIQKKKNRFPIVVHNNLKHNPKKFKKNTHTHTRKIYIDFTLETYERTCGFIGEFQRNKITFFI